MFASWWSARESERSNMTAACDSLCSDSVVIDQSRFQKPAQGRTSQGVNHARCDARAFALTVPSRCVSTCCRTSFDVANLTCCGCASADCSSRLESRCYSRLYNASRRMQFARLPVLCFRSRRARSRSAVVGAAAISDAIRSRDVQRLKYQLVDLLAVARGVRLRALCVPCACLSHVPVT